MVREARIRLLAETFRERLGVSDTASGAAVVAAALAHLGIAAVPLQPSDALLVGAVAVLDRPWRRIWHSSALAGPGLVSVLAHEIGHAVLDPDGEAGDHSLADAPDWCDGPRELAYSPAQRGETEANLFAAEMLAPRRAIRHILGGELTLQYAAEAWGVPERMVLAQCVAHAADRGHDPQPDAGGGAVHLDADQWAAVSSPSSRLMVHAGPGTGKTRCIVERITHLIERGAAPGRMLVLTFSNNAADELIERMGARLGGNGRLVRVFTFHAFGLELLRTFHSAAGLPASPKVIDTVEAVEMLLAHPGVFEAVMPAGRSEVARAHALLGLLNRLRDAGVDADGVRLRAEAGEVPLELAEAFAAWNRLLADAGAIDFASMVTGAARLLLSQPSVGIAVGQSLDHILIDEAQDITLMDAVLVRAISDHGASIWAVGDTAQAIYTFRPSALGSDLAVLRAGISVHDSVSLTSNYRSLGDLVRLHAELAHALNLDVACSERRVAHRGDGGEALFVHAEDEDAQAEGVAGHLKDRLAHIGAHDSAVLCRTHAQCRAMARALQVRGLPVSVEGGLLDCRPAMALAAVVALFGEAGSAPISSANGSAALGLTADEVQRWSHATDTGRVAPFAALQAMKDRSAGLAHAHDLLAEASSGRSAASLLGRLLFGGLGLWRRSGWDAAAQPGRLRTLLRLADKSESPERFMARLRMMLELADDRSGQDAGAGQADAVRIMTAHSAKGLEFGAVVVPQVANGGFPQHRKGGHGSAGGEGDDPLSEARLLYVAATRARDSLMMVAPERTGPARRRAGDILGRPARQAFGSAGLPTARWEALTPAPAADDPPAPVVDLRLSRWLLDAYHACPMRYLLARRHRAPQALPPLHAYRMALVASVRLIEDVRRYGRSVSYDEAMEQWSAAWASRVAARHIDVAVWRLRAATALRSWIDSGARLSGDFQRQVEVDTGVGIVVQRAEYVVETASTVMVAVIDDGLAGAPPPVGGAAGRASICATVLSEGRAASVARLRLHGNAQDDLSQPAQAKGNTLMADYRRSLIGIAAAQFEPRVHHETCSGCAYLFACPAVSAPEAA